MIWNGDTALADELVVHLRDEIRALAPAADVPAEDVARGVAAYWRQRHDRQMLSSDYVAHLVACALGGLGGPAADLQAEGRGNGGPRSLEVWRRLAARLYRPLVRADGEPAWLLDLTRVPGMDSDMPELSWFPALRLLVNGMAELWDDTAGAGALALRIRLPGGLSERSRRRWRRDVTRFAGAVLARLGALRRWSAVPRVLWLDDLSARAGG